MPVFPVSQVTIATAFKEQASVLETYITALPVVFDLPEEYKDVSAEVLMHVFVENVQALIRVDYQPEAILGIISATPSILFDQSGEFAQTYLD